MFGTPLFVYDSSYWFTEVGNKVGLTTMRFILRLKRGELGFFYIILYSEEMFSSIF
jgi:hypothetical protein